MVYETIRNNNADIAICGAERVWDTGMRRKNPISNRELYTVIDKTESLKKYPTSFGISYISVKF